MQLNAKLVGAGMAAFVAASVGYVLLARREEAFETLEREGAFSVRDYPRLRVAETIADGMRESALARGVLAIADYLCGSAGSAMTGPIYADGDEDGRGWRTRVVMSAKLADALPEPGDDVVVRDLPPRRIAAVRFAGEASDEVLDAHEDALRDWMRAHSLRAAGPVEHAFYNPPFTPGMLRRNEVLIPLAA
jgi:hypothetical protein